MPDPNILIQPERDTEASIFSYVQAALGYPFVEVEIERQQMQHFVKLSLELYSRVIPKIRWFSIPAFAGIQEYPIPQDTVGYGLTQVMIPRLDPIAPLLLSSGPRLDIFGYRYSYPYRDISELFVDYFYFQEAQKILSSDFQWEYFDGAIHIHPRPDEPFPMTYASAFPHTLTTIPSSDTDWIREHVLAQCKQAVGMARRKFVVHGAQTEQVMDGAALVQEGREEKARLEEDLYNRIPPLPLYREL